MIKKSIQFIFLIYGLWACGSVENQIDGQIGKWRVVAGPPGNEFYEPPLPQSEQKPPTEALLKYAKIFVPHIEVNRWEKDEVMYKIRCESDGEKYKIDVTPEGELNQIRYRNNKTGIEEEADALVYRGTKKEIELNMVPVKALSTLAEAYPKMKPSRAWSTETVAGQRYGIQMGNMIFYARPDGQIQAALAADDGGLNEIYTEAMLNGSEFKADLEKYLGRYREKFNFKNQLKKLGSKPKNADGSYRYLVFGDNRSNWELWSNMVKHIESLNPKPSFVLNTGDIVPKGMAKELNEYYIPPLLKTDIPFFVAIGNHEAGDERVAREYQYLFGDKSMNYHFDYGNSRYILLDNTSEVEDYETTLKWLEETLADTPQEYYKYVVAHKPPTTIKKWAYHAWKDKESKIFTDLMSKYLVDEVYLGHIHAYSTANFNGIKYTLSGGGGAELHNRYGPDGSVHHYVICDVSADGKVSQQVVRFYDKSHEEK